MISWTEQAPDFGYHAVERLSARLTFTAVCSLFMRSRRGPAIVIDSSTWGTIIAHLGSARVEQGGLLIGKAYNSSVLGEMIVAIEAAIPSKMFDGTSVSLVMGSQVWEDARIAIKEGQSVVGWYHSHPNLGAFFSGTDRRTQKQFFDNRHSTALVYDPIRREQRWFIGGDSNEVSLDDVYVDELTDLTL